MNRLKMFFTIVLAFAVTFVVADGRNLTFKNVTELLDYSGTAATGDLMFVYDASDADVKSDDLATILGTATGAEITRAADVSARIVTLTTNTSITTALHEGKLIVLSEPGGNAAMEATLPEATGSGGVFCFVIGVANTAEYEISVATNDVFYGQVTHIDGNLQSTINAVVDYASGVYDTINMDSDTNTGGSVGDKVCVTDFATGSWMADGFVASDGDAYATVFSSDKD